MNRILDQERFRWTPSWQTDVMATFKKHGFKRTTAKERAQRSEPNSHPRGNVRYLAVRKASGL